MTSTTPATPVPASVAAPTDAQRAAAADPATPAGRLLVLAGNQPRLREVIGRNPACPPELRSWITRAQAGSGQPGGPGRAGGPSPDASRGAHQPDSDVPDALDVPDAPQEASWAPHGWEPSDVGLGPDPFGSVLGDPLTGSPLSDVSMGDSSMDDGVDDEEQQAGPEGAPGGAPSLSRPVHGIPGRYSE